MNWDEKTTDLQDKSPVSDMNDNPKVQDSDTKCGFGSFQPDFLQVTEHSTFCRYSFRVKGDIIGVLLKWHYAPLRVIAM